MERHNPSKYFYHIFFNVQNGAELDTKHRAKGGEIAGPTWIFLDGIHLPISKFSFNLI